MESENLSSLIRLSVSDGQKTDSSNVVSFIGIIKYSICFCLYLIGMRFIYLQSMCVGVVKFLVKLCINHGFSESLVLLKKTKILFGSNVVF